MADPVLGTIQIQALPAASLPLDGTELLHLKQGTGDRRATLTDVLAPHANLQGNPHHTTPTDIGLGNVLNAAQLTVANNLNDLSNKVTARTNLQVYSKTETDAKYVPQTRKVAGHPLDADVTISKTDVGLSNVPNYPKSDDYKEDADKLATARSVSALYRAIQAQYPVGTIYPSLNAANPSTYLLCGGTWVLTGKGQAVVGFNGDNPAQAAVDGRAVNSTFGSSTKTISVANLPSHKHTVTLTGGDHIHRILGTTQGAGSHSHSFSGSTSTFDYGTKSGGTDQQGNHQHGGSTDSGGAHRHQYAGDDQLAVVNIWGIAQERLGRYDADSDTDNWARAYWTSTDGQHGHTFTTGWGGQHGHNVAVNIGAHNHTFGGTTGGVGDHGHNMDFNSQSSGHTHSGETDNTGTGAAFNVEQPSLVVYLWARTA